MTFSSNWLDVLNTELPLLCTHLYAHHGLPFPTARSLQQQISQEIELGRIFKVLQSRTQP